MAYVKELFRKLLSRNRLRCVVLTDWHTYSGGGHTQQFRLSLFQVVFPSSLATKFSEVVFAGNCLF